MSTEAIKNPGLLNKLSTLIESKVGLENALADARARIEELEGELATSDAERESLRAELSTAREDLATATRERDDLRARGDELAEALEAAENEAVTVQGAAADVVASEFGADPRELPAQASEIGESDEAATVEEAADKMRATNDPAERARHYKRWKELSAAAAGMN